MDVTFTPLDPAGADRDALVALLTENAWPFHTRPRVTRPEAEKAVDGGAWEDEDHRTFWIEHPEHGRVGVVRLEDLTDPTPLFDLRVAERFRGRGLGEQILTALTRHVFETMPAAHIVNIFHVFVSVTKSPRLLQPETPHFLLVARPSSWPTLRHNWRSAATQ